MVIEWDLRIREWVKRLDNAASSKLAIIGFPFDMNSSYMDGPAAAPPLIREAFHSESSNQWAEAGINLGEESVFDAGDLSFESIAHAFRDIEESINHLLDHNLVPISLGGDHSITFPIIKAFNKKYPIMHILQFDAHPDLYHEYQGNPYSHASVFSRIMENRLVDRLVQVGIRTANNHQRVQAERYGVEMIEMKDWKDNIDLKFRGPLYISFDMDVLDPAFAPGVSHFEPGGLSTRQVIKLIQNLKVSEIVGADIVELNPKRDPLGVTAMTASKVLKEIAARVMSQQGL